MARLRATGTGAGAADGAGAGGAGAGPGELLFRAELGAAAHTGPAGRYARLRYEAEILSFIVTAAS